MHIQQMRCKVQNSPCFLQKGHKKADTATDTIVSITVSVMAESVRFELTVGRPITSFQDWLLKPLGHLSVFNEYTTERRKSQEKQEKGIS